ncbi:FAD-dependent oxidoreductase [Streptomyces olivaceoviridis]
MRNWSAERWTSPSTVQRLDGHSLFGHPLSQRPALGDRLHWASTETATERAGHIEGALSSGERAALAVLAAPSGADEPGTGVIGAGTEKSRCHAPARNGMVVARHADALRRIVRSHPRTPRSHRKKSPSYEAPSDSDAGNPFPVHGDTTAPGET